MTTTHLYLPHNLSTLVEGLIAGQQSLVDSLELLDGDFSEPAERRRQRILTSLAGVNDLVQLLDNDMVRFVAHEQATARGEGAAYRYQRKGVA